MIRLERNALVWGVVGNLGGGKTLSAVQLGVNAMLSGYYVVSNITFNLDEIARAFSAPWISGLYQRISIDDDGFDPFKLPCGDPRGSGGRRRVMVILDEIAEWFDQYTSSKDLKLERFRSWLRHSSKRSQDVILVCQRQEYIAKPVRALIARWIWVDDLQVYRLPIVKARIPFMGGYVMQNVFDRQGSRIDSASIVSKVRWGRFYNTAECLNADGAAYNAVYSVPDRPPPNYVPLYLLYGGSLVYLFYSLMRIYAK